MIQYLSDILLPAILNMSLTSSIVILFVIAIRLLLKPAPKIFSYGLWAVVLFRLLCPISFSGEFSLLSTINAPIQQEDSVISMVRYLPASEVTQSGFSDHPSTFVSDQSPSFPSVSDTESPHPKTLITLLWLTGVVGIAGYNILRLLRLRHNLIGALHLQDNIYLADHVESPFVLGLLRPRIYLPSALSVDDASFLIQHELHHIKRGDPIIKTVSFATLCLHWFNPLVWMAFLLSTKDMEMSCDEAVLKKLGDTIRGDYSASLLALSTGHSSFSGVPLAFGEVDPKGRIRNILRWKKPKLWLSLVAGAACIMVILFCVINPVQEQSSAVSPEEAVLNALLNTPDAQLKQAYDTMDFDAITATMEKLVGDYVSPEYLSTLLKGDSFSSLTLYAVTLGFTSEVTSLTVENDGLQSTYEATLLLTVNETQETAEISAQGIIQRNEQGEITAITLTGNELHNFYRNLA